ncbi:MAG: radical SAM protein [Anaerolineae bacterium]|nr:radical SAM protein [Anaerolineae bacterium]NUQ04066.1 cobalamin B12-binding domain-containing protein [Anaerolineae bacterium]
MKIMLLFPPNWTPSMPHLALPTLTAYLRGNGIEVIQRDLNATTFDEILTSGYIRKSLTRLREYYGQDASRHPKERRGLPRREHVLWALSEGERLAREVEAAKQIIRSEQFFDGATSLPAFETVIQALEVASMPFFPASLTLQTYISAYPTDSSAALLQAVRDEHHNIFLELFREGILREIAREHPDIVGISIPSMPQMLAGMTLAYLVKDAGLDCHVTVGGPHISMLRDELVKVPAIFSLFDSAVVFDGEVPLLRLAEALSGDGDLSTVPNLVYRDGDAIRVTERKVPEKISDLPMPDFDGLPLDRYLAPYLALPLLTARGCYFGKCAFCNVGYGEAESFSQLRVEQLVEQMTALRSRYGVRHIFFSDEAISPKNLRALPLALETIGAPFHWGGCARFERVITRDLLESMQRGGCRMILYGLESASEAIMDRMLKGTRAGDMSRILIDGSEAGIWNHTFFFFGFPGETLEDAQATVNFLYQHKPHIHSAAMGTFLMERYSPAHQFPQRFGVSKIVEEPEKDLAIYFDYEVAQGMNAAFAETIADRFMETLPDKPFPQFYANDVYRFLYASYLSEKGKPMVPWLIPEPQQA